MPDKTRNAICITNPGISGKTRYNLYITKPMYGQLTNTQLRSAASFVKSKPTKKALYGQRQADRHSGKTRDEPCIIKPCMDNVR